jgi:hypothetical protein
MGSVKKALTSAAVYFVIAGALYLLILALPDQIGFYGLMLFYVIHLVGVILIRPFYTHGVAEPRYLGYVVTSP